MDRYAGGDETAFPELYDALAPRLFRFALRTTGDAQAAEDVVQLTMLQVHRARGQFVRGASVVPWAMAIARRFAIDTHRRGRKESLFVAEPPETASDEASAEQIAQAAETARRIERELAKLPETQRTAFELVKQEGLSVAQAAAVLGVTVSAVKLRAHRAYQALREALGDLAPRDEKGEEP